MSIKVIRLDYWKLIVFFRVSLVFHVRVRPFLGFKKEELWLVRNAINMSKLCRI
jgi:hypothetical protein